MKVNKRQSLHAQCSYLYYPIIQNSVTIQLVIAKTDKSMDYTNSQPGHASSGSHSQAFSCHLCGRQFKSSSTFAEHTKVFHTRGTIPARPREALFPCKECGKAFTSPSKRTIHQNTVHKGLRPHQCHVCEKSFGYKGGMYQNIFLLHIIEMIAWNFLTIISSVIYNNKSNRSDKGKCYINSTKN